MQRPVLTVYAGCNGSGKSSHSTSLNTDSCSVFDFDKTHREIYDKLLDIDIKDQMARNQTTMLFEKLVKEAIENKSDFAYETNFHFEPMYWPELFRRNGYQINLNFFCLESIELAQERVAIRVENGGHFVPNKEIESRFKLGYKNLDKHCGDFDLTWVFESSSHGNTPVPLALFLKGIWFETDDHFPNYFARRLPNLSRQIT